MAQKASVLVVDDDESMLEYCAQILARLGFAVTAAATGREALAHLASEPYDIVLTDHITVGSMAVPVHRAVRNLQPAARVVLMSGIPTLAEASASYLAGARAYLAKPFTLAELESAMDACLRVQPEPSAS